MGLFWNLFQQSQISEQYERSDSLKNRVKSLESELYQTQKQFHDLVSILEKEFGKDINRDGRIG